MVRPSHIQFLLLFFLAGGFHGPCVRGCRAQVLYFAVEALLRSGHEDVYAAVERPLQLAQTAAVLEVLPPAGPLDLASVSRSKLCILPDPPRARRAGEVAGVRHAAADRVAALRHLGHPLELPRGAVLFPMASFSVLLAACTPDDPLFPLFSFLIWLCRRGHTSW